MRPVARTALFVLLLSAAASAAGTVDGPWAGRSAADASDAPAFQLSLKTEGTALTGWVNDNTQRFTIENGTAVDGALVFDAVQPVEGGTSTLGMSCRGTMNSVESDDTIDLTCQIAGGGQKAYALKRLVGA